MNIYLPILVIVLSNTFYNICAKSTPENVNTFASLIVTYFVGILGSLLMFFATSKGESLVKEFHNLNWTSFVLGLAVVGLEAGFVLLYRAGWNISTGQVITSVLLAVVLIFIGKLFYHEPFTMRKFLGIALCMVGLYLINKK